MDPIAREYLKRCAERVDRHPPSCSVQPSLQPPGLVLRLRSWRDHRPCLSAPQPPHRPASWTFAAEAPMTAPSPASRYLRSGARHKSFSGSACSTLRHKSPPRFPSAPRRTWARDFHRSSDLRRRSRNVSRARRDIWRETQPPDLPHRRPFRAPWRPVSCSRKPTGIGSTG